MFANGIRTPYLQSCDIRHQKELSLLYLGNFCLTFSFPIPLRNSENESDGLKLQQSLRKKGAHLKYFNSNQVITVQTQHFISQTIAQDNTGLKLNRRTFDRKPEKNWKCTPQVLQHNDLSVIILSPLLQSHMKTQVAQTQIDTLLPQPLGSIISPSLAFVTSHISKKASLWESFSRNPSAACCSWPLPCTQCQKSKIIFSKLFV